MGKCFESRKKTSSPEQLWDAEPLLRATGRKERSVSWSCVFITGGGEVLTAERLLSSTFGLTSSLCLDKLDWESFHSQSAQCAVQSHFSTSLKSRRELQSSFPLAPIQLAPTGCSEPGALQGHIPSCEQPPAAPAPRRPPWFGCGNTNPHWERSGTCAKLTLCNECYPKCKCKWVNIGMNPAERS